MGCCDDKPAGGDYVVWTSLKTYGVAKAADLLSERDKDGNTTKRVKPEDIAIIDFGKFPTDHYATIHRDVCLGQYGISEGMPAVQNSGQHSEGFLSYGIHLYACKKDRTKRYCFYYNRGMSEIYILMKKTDIFKIMRLCYAQCKLSLARHQPPIMEKNVLQDVLDNTVNFLKARKRMEKYGVKINRGILLGGTPGNGKTMLCRYLKRLCRDANLSTSTVTSSQINEAYKNNVLSSLFNGADVTFFDDIDITYLSRSAGDGKIACALLAAMDGMDNKTGFRLRIFTSNEDVESLDPAFTRPGRIDRIVNIPKPNEKMRYALIATWDKSITDNIDVDFLVDSTEGSSFVDLEAVKAFLVTGYLFGKKKWDLKRSLKLLKERGVEEKKVAGFITEMPTILEEDVEPKELTAAS